MNFPIYVFYEVFRGAAAGEDFVFKIGPLFDEVLDFVLALLGVCAGKRERNILHWRICCFAGTLGVVELLVPCRSGLCRWFPTCWIIESRRQNGTSPC